MKVVSLWSGGKDSCLACFKAIREGYEVAALFNFTQLDGKNSLSHGLSSELLRQQAELTGMPFLQKAMPKQDYRNEFKALITEWKEEKGIQGIVFGDIYLQEHKDWIDKVCQELEVKPIFPLWGKDTQELISEIIDSGFEAIVVTVKEELLGEEWLGRRIDKKFVEELKEGIDPCGEKGEFHTLVIDGPIFKKRMKIITSQIISKDGYAYLEIKDYKTVPK